MTQQVRPLVGVNVEYVPPAKNAGPQLRLHAGYAECVYAAGGLPVLIPPVAKEQELEDLLDRLDGVVLAGSQYDLDPRRAGLPLHPTVSPMPPTREDADRMLCKLAMERRMPILAVAAGMHTLNVLGGGSLFMHLPEDLPKTLPHRDPGGGPHRHIVLVEPHTRLDAIYGEVEIRVNSYHHQAIQTVAGGFKVSGKAPDGVIEAIESEDPDWFCMGVQWHPHSETASALDMQLIEAFAQACAEKEVRLKIAA